MSAADSLERFLTRAREAPDAPPADALLVVALSGGRDSVALLHLLRFGPSPRPVRLVAAHLDHAMRPGSAADARWIRGLCRAWGVPLRTRRLELPPGDEAEARHVRYRFLETVRKEEGGDRILTAHHGDDQAETVLFRAARGSGLRGLRGILPSREPHLWRPLLEAPGAAVASYARRHRLRWREDPTNRLPRPRNVLRHEILPRLEEAVAPGAKEALARLARRAREEEEAWASLLPSILEPLELRVEEAGFSLLQAPLAEHHPAVRARILRALARRAGTTLTEAGTRSAVTFSTAGPSGTGLDLPGGVTLRRELDRLVFLREDPGGADRPLEIPSARAGSGEATVGGRLWRVCWGPEAGGELQASFPADHLRFPLVVRSRATGDRVRFRYGTKKVKKILLEARVPPRERERLPVVAEATGDVLWIPGIALSTRAADGAHDPLLHIGFTDVHDD